LENVKPITVKNPLGKPFLFWMRCLFDLQLKTINDALKPLLSTFPNGRILDVGAGESPWLCYLPKASEYQGIDVQFAEAFGMKPATAKVAYFDGMNIPFEDRSFDGAFCIEVLEHARNPDRLLSEISRVLRAGAPLILSVPWSARRHFIPYDYHRFTPEKLTLLFQENQFQDIEVRDRGNVYCVIFNKLFIVWIGNLRKISMKNFIFLLLLNVVLLPAVLLMFLLSHGSLLLQDPKNSSEDPLGYLVIAKKI
jgi:SAM-dependent methyltransferase